MNSNPVYLTIAFIAPIGVDLKNIESSFKSELLNEYGYQVQTLKITEETEFSSAKSASDPYRRYMSLMDCGDEIRRNSHKNDILAERISQKIKNSKKQVYIINQLKTPEEVVFLRNMLNSNKHPFFAISIFDTKENRSNFISNKINGSRLESHETNMSLAEKLISRDEKDIVDSFGQNVRETFPLADFFLDATEKSHLQEQVERVLKIVFSHPHTSPKKEEYGMYIADAASLRSRDLSRQVGASILDSLGSVVVTGCNEVPKAFGGTYWEGEGTDNRDFCLQHDSSYQYRNAILSELFNIFSNIKELPDEVRAFFENYASTSKVLNFLENDKYMSSLKKTRIMNLIEFSRSDHAEVDAISNAARSGVSIKDCTLYTTVFPCHICARYIISGGIKEVVFIEPYPKSLTLELYATEISINDDKKVKLKSYIGVAPRIYRKAFLFDASMKMPKKENDSSLTSWHPNLKKWVLL